MQARQVGREGRGRVAKTTAKSRLRAIGAVVRAAGVLAGLAYRTSHLITRGEKVVGLSCLQLRALPDFLPAIERVHYDAAEDSACSGAGVVSVCSTSCTGVNAAPICCMTLLQSIA